MSTCTSDNPVSALVLKVVRPQYSLLRKDTVTVFLDSALAEGVSAEADASIESETALVSAVDEAVGTGVSSANTASVLLLLKGTTKLPAAMARDRSRLYSFVLLFVILSSSFF